MTNREKIWKRAKGWVAGWQGGKSKPTPEMAFVAGWQAAMRQQKRDTRLPVGFADPPPPYVTEA